MLRFVQLGRCFLILGLFERDLEEGALDLSFNRSRPDWAVVSWFVS